jgi:chromosome segregation protein
MYLSRLELHGFKSFAQKTAVAFSPGVTAIVGPNGCGKSNVIDAVRWVLGEQRARLLRSDAMAGVIFNGAEGRRPLGMAEVSLTVENTRGVLPTEYAEVTVTRRLYRSGDSEYLLNGTACRLRDVLDLFMDTGMGAGAYSVIELSMVEDILSDNADDRRRLFEEAAGITKYKRRRAQALRRLDATRADLTRLDDIVDEVEKQVRSLARQAQKAARHERWAARLRRLELALAAHDLARLDAERGRLEATARERRAEAEGLAVAVSAGEARLETARADLAHCDAARDEAARALAAHAQAVAAVEAEVRVADERRASGERALARIASERAADDARADDARAEREGALGLAAAAAARVADAQAALDATQAARDAAAADAADRRRALDDARRSAATARGALGAAQSARDRARDRRALLDSERARIEADTLDAPPDDANTADALANAEAALDRAEAAARAAAADAEAAREAAEAARTDRQRALAARDTARAEADLLRSFVGADDGGGAAALAASGWRAPTVAEVVATDDADRLALDAALGAWAGAFVVQTGAEAEDALGRLRAADAGRATFIVLDRLADAEPLAPAGATPALDLVRTAAPYRPLLRRLLRGVFVADDLDEAHDLQGRHPAARVVTRDGAWVDAAAVHGGSPTPSRGAARLGLAERREQAATALAEAETALDRAEREAETARGARAQAEAARDAVDAERDAARAARDAARDAHARHQARATAHEERADRLRQRAAEVAAALDALADDDALDAAVREAEAAVRSAAEHVAEAEAAAEAAETRRADTEAAWSDARLAHARAQAEERAARDARDRAARTLADVTCRQRERDEEEARLRAGAAAAEQANAERRAHLDAERERTDGLQTAAEAAETAVLEARAAIAEAEAETRAGRQKREAATTALADADRRLVEVTTRQETTRERLADEHGATPEQAEAELDRLQAEELFQPDTARAEVPDLRQKIRGLGAVNALALEDYEEAEGRLGFLREQRADLADAERSLLATIREINETARWRFDETFAAVREAFQTLFRDLFGGDAAADLALDGDDPLEAPVSITARPRGKRPVSLGQLSGGEKTLTATALLFAIYLVKPSPFCILDEVDAPLDDANVGRFMRLVRSFADSTQFVLVTHNKLTMEAADRLYGVTMPTPGVSRLVGVRFDGGGASGDGAAQAAAPPEAA